MRDRVSLPIVRLLLDNGADPNYQQPLKANPNRMSLPLATACDLRDQPLIDLLLAHGAKE